MDCWVQKIVLTMRIAFLLGCSILFAGSCKSDVKDAVLPYYDTADFTPVFVKAQQNIDVKIPHRIADFSFTDQHDKAITQKDIEGKIHVANFFFTSCGSICPKLTTGMASVSDAYLNAGVVMLSYSVNPSTDNVIALNAYAAKNGITDPNWHLLTGSKSEIYSIARKSYFAEEDLGLTKDSTSFLHTEHFLLIDKTRRIRGIYNGTLELEIEQLIKDIAELKKEG